VLVFWSHSIEEECQQILLTGRGQQLARPDKIFFACEVYYEISDRIAVPHHRIKRYIIENVYKALLGIEITNRERAV
jgi:hypothetical protein